MENTATKEGWRGPSGVWERAGKLAPEWREDGTDPTPRFLLSVCGAAFLGSLWGTFGSTPSLAWLVVSAVLAFACSVHARSRTWPRASPTRYLLPPLIGLAACMRADRPIEATPPPCGTAPTGQVRALIGGSGSPVVQGRWRSHGSSRDDTRGSIGDRLEIFRLARGSVTAGETVSVLSGAGRVLRARPPDGARPSLTFARHPDVAWIRVAPDDLVRAPGAPPSTMGHWYEWISGMRQAGLRRAYRLDSESARNLYRALLFGDRGAWSTSASDLFTRTGTRHVLSLSGLHVGLLSWLVAQPLGTLIAWGLNSLLRLVRLRGACSPVLIQALLVWLFVPLAGGNPPVVRAAWALTLAQFARWIPTTGQRIGRRPKALHLWAFALLLECLADPSAPGRLGVQLSYAATLGLVVGYAGARKFGMNLRQVYLPLHSTSATGHPRAAWWRIPAEWVANLVVSSTAASFVAVVATLPITWCSFGEWSPWGLVAMPLILPPLILFMGCASVWTLVPLDGLRSWVELAGHGLLALLNALDRLPGTPTQLPPRPFWLLVALAAATLWLAANHAAGRRVTDRIARAVVAALGGLWLPWTTAARTLEVVSLDVGHGTAVILRAPGEACWIFDAGSRDRPSIAREAIAPLLRAWESTEVNLVVSHDHRDHTSALPWLTRRWVPRLWAGSDVSGIEVPARLDLEGGRTQLPTRTAALQLDLLRGQSSPGNEGSRSLEVRWGDELLVLCGDAEAAGLAHLLRRGELQGPVRLVLLPHHGADGRETEALLRRLRPRQAWISRASQVPTRGLLRELAIPWRSTADGALQLILGPPARFGPGAGETDP